MKVWNDIAVGNIYRKVGPHGPMDIIDRLMVLEISESTANYLSYDEVPVVVDVTVLFEGGEKQVLTLVYDKYEHAEVQFAEVYEDGLVVEAQGDWSETYELDELD